MCFVHVCSTYIHLGTTCHMLYSHEAVASYCFIASITSLCFASIVRSSVDMNGGQGVRSKAPVKETEGGIHKEPTPRKQRERL